MFRLLSRLPMAVLFAIADTIVYPLLFYILRYRRKIVRNNLVTSFPEKPLHEIKIIERQFYHWLCDYVFETLKLLTISPQELKRRYQIHNIPQVEECLNNGQDVTIIFGHYCNWEWLSTSKSYFAPQFTVAFAYKTLHNKTLDKLFVNIRNKQGGTSVPKDLVLRAISRFRSQQVRHIFGLNIDQTPKWESIHLWLPFLNHDTPVFTGAERIARKYNNAVFFAETIRPKRGYYTTTCQLITTQPKQLPEHEITKIFFQKLEQLIRQQPAYYLWTHNRWKRTHEEYNRRYNKVTR